MAPRSRARQSEVPDDLKLIHGIREGIEGRLLAVGITSYRRLAGSSPEEIATVLHGVVGMSAKRITRENWIGQATALAGNAHPATEEPALDDDRQSYATFTLELLRQPDGAVRGTRVTHVQSGETEPVAGWDEAAVLRFIRAHATLAPSVAPHPSPSPPPARGPEPSAAMTVRPVGHREPRRVLQPHESFDVGVILDLDEVLVAPAFCTLDVTAKALADRVTSSLGASSVTVEPPSERAELSVRSGPLPSGLYRLRASVRNGDASPPFVIRTLLQVT